MPRDRRHSFPLLPWRHRRGSRFSLFTATLAVLVAAVGVSGQLFAAGPAGAASKPVSKNDMLRLSSFPKGWSQTQTTTLQTPSNTLLVTIGPCDGGGVVSFTGTPSRTRSFKKPQGKTPAFTAFEGVSRFRTAAQASSAWAVINNTKAPGCVGLSFTKHLTGTATFTKTGLSVTPPAATALTATPYGADTISFGFHYTVKGPRGLNFTTRVQFMAALRGTYLVVLFVTGYHPAPSLLRQILTAAAARVA